MSGFAFVCVETRGHCPDWLPGYRDQWKVLEDRKPNFISLTNHWPRFDTGFQNQNHRLDLCSVVYIRPPHNFKVNPTYYWNLEFGEFKERNEKTIITLRSETIQNVIIWMENVFSVNFLLQNHFWQWGPSESGIKTMLVSLSFTTVASTLCPPRTCAKKEIKLKTTIFRFRQLVPGRRLVSGPLGELHGGDARSVLLPWCWGLRPWLHQLLQTTRR